MKTSQNALPVTLLGLASATLIGLAMVLPFAASIASDEETAFAESVRGLTYEEARWHPLHFKPAIDEATNGQCLACHQGILDRDVLPESPAGVLADESRAWYQTLDTYQGDQQTFHQRHLTSEFARDVMNLSCNFCHQGNDPREESPSATATDSPFTLRKVVNPSETCLRCHGTYSWEMMGTGPWHEARVDFEDEETPNGCLICHGELYRTVRHQVTYLNGDTIEDLAQSSSDVCFGCHGGRAWYNIPYPYPRHPWPDMDEDVPEWAEDRPTGSDARFQIEPQ